MFARGRPVMGWGKDDIKSELESIIYHLGNYFLLHQTDCFNTGISINFNKPWLEVLVDHKIQAKEFKNWFLRVALYEMSGSFD